MLTQTPKESAKKIERVLGVIEKSIISKGGKFETVKQLDVVTEPDL
jgi:hypothetical protein